MASLGRVDGPSGGRCQLKLTSTRKTNAIMNFFVDEEHLKREKHKARVLRNSQWWKRKVARGVCHYCGKRFSPGELTMDHIVPISRGGMSKKGNVAPSCKNCNTQKKQLLPMEWEQYLNKAAKDAKIS